MPLNSPMHPEAEMSRRLILVVSSFPKLSETFIVSKFLGLLERGGDVHVVCGVSEEAQYRHFPNRGNHFGARRIKVAWPHRPRWLAGLLMPFAFLHCLWSNPPGTWRYLRRGARRFGWGVLRRFYLDARIVALSPDLVHFEFGALAAERADLKTLLGCRMITSFRGYDLNYAGLEEPDYYRKVWESTDALHLLGIDLWRRAQNRGCPPTKSHALIPPAIDVEFFSPSQCGMSDRDDLPGRRIRILSVGRLEWKKGYEYSIQAIRRLRDSGVRCEYCIIGHGSYLEPLAFARHQLDLHDDVIFAGALTPSQVRDRMRSADIFLHSAVSEGFCNAVLEAQAMALPVVCSDADGLPENVVDGETGFLVHRRDAQSLAEKLAVLSRDAVLRQKMGEAGRRRVLKRFQLTDQIDAFDRLYRSVFTDDSPKAKEWPAKKAEEVVLELGS